MYSYTAKNLESDQEIRWCPGCGDYAILKQVQNILPKLNIPRENIVFVSGIGCSSRFPYYMNLYGMHSIHGRAAAIASGLKMSNSELNVWVVTGDGDGMSIGLGHTLHLLRRNFNINVLLFNNQIYGLTKGQYSPTSEKNKITKSTPYGSLDHPFIPAKLAFAADASFVARTIDRNTSHLQDMLIKANNHKGTSFLEIYQNCNIFNDGVFDAFIDRLDREENCLLLEHGKPLIFGKNKSKGIFLDSYKPRIVNIEEESISVDQLWIHDEKDKIKAGILLELFNDSYFPRPFGVFYCDERSCYEYDMKNQIDQEIKLKSKGDLQELITGSSTWVVE